MCLSQCIGCWIDFQNIQTFTYQKTLLLFLKSSKAFSVSLTNVLEYACKIGEVIDIETNIPRVVGGQINRANAAADTPF